MNKLNWIVLECGDYGSIVLEEAIYQGIVFHVRNYGGIYDASFDSKEEPYYDVKTYSTKRDAKKWCERMAEELCVK